MNKKLVAGTVAGALVIAVVITGLLFTRGGDHRSTVAVRRAASDRQAVTTTAAPGTTTTKPAVAAPPSSTAPADESSMPSDDPPQSTDPRTMELQCIDYCDDSFVPPGVTPGLDFCPPNASYDPLCGPFHWEPAVDDQPAVIESVVFDPPRPVAGEHVTATITWSDPDADLANLSMVCDGSMCLWMDGGLYGCSAQGPPTGVWTAPPSSPGRGILQWDLVFPDPGAASWSFEVDTTSSVMWAFDAEHGCVADPYRGMATASGTIGVAPRL